MNKNEFTNLKCNLIAIKIYRKIVKDYKNMMKIGFYLHEEEKLYFTSSTNIDKKYISSDVLDQVIDKINELAIEDDLKISYSISSIDNIMFEARAIDVNPRVLKK